MPLTTYTAGQVLTASSLNANFSFAASSGALQLVKTQTIGSAVASVAVTDAFSATYENYLITVNGGAGSTNASLSMILGATTAGYYNAFANSPFNEGGLSGIGTSNGAIWNFMGYATTTGVNMTATLQSPQLAKQTFLSAAYVNASAVGGSGSGQNNGYLNNTTQYTGFTISTSTGTLTGGTIRIYGYANS